MEAIAHLREAPTSPRKMRMVADMVRGQKIANALAILKHQPQSGAEKLYNLLLSAIANWRNAHESEMNLEDANLYIKTIFVNGGTMLKRMQPAPQGRAYRKRKRSNHVTIVIAPEKTIN